MWALWHEGQVCHGMKVRVRQRECSMITGLHKQTQVWCGQNAMRCHMRHRSSQRRKHEEFGLATLLVVAPMRIRLVGSVSEGSGDLPVALPTQHKHGSAPFAGFAPRAAHPLFRGSARLHMMALLGAGSAHSTRLPMFEVHEARCALCRRTELRMLRSHEILGIGWGAHVIRHATSSQSQGR